MTRSARALALASIAAVILSISIRPRTAGAGDAAFTLRDVLAYPFASDLVAAPRGQRIAWTLLQRGERSVWVADGPAFVPRRVWVSEGDDGQEISSLVFSSDGNTLLFVRGGDHGANWPAPGNLQPNPTSRPIEPTLQVWAVRVDQSDARAAMIGEGDAPAPQPGGPLAAFVRGSEIWAVPMDGSRPAARLFFARGTNSSPAWSPDGRTLAFVTDRGDVSHVGLYRGDSEPIRYLGPGVWRDSAPRWHPDGSRVAFVRRPARGGAAQPRLEPRPQPWSLWVGDVTTLEATRAWRSPETDRGSFPRTEGGPNLHWAAGDRLLFLANLDGWPHLYSVPASGGDPLLLTPGAFMVEFVAMAPDRQSVVYSANAGSEADDVERRHLFRVPIDDARSVTLTSGPGIETQPAATADGAMLTYIGADARRPPLPVVQPLGSAAPVRRLLQETVPPTFPGDAFVVPEHVTFTAPDGLDLHGELFRSPTGPERRPAVVFVHGGPPRQMLLGWHYRQYYANAYAMNQYLASRGYIVLSVNYRLGIGFGHEFMNPPQAGARGAAEYQDVLAAGRWLRARADVDAGRVGIWGGSYGGYLTALALGRSSDVFAAGVDIHGVHDRVVAPSEELAIAAAVGDGVTREEVDEALRVAWRSSPVSSVATWRSPVLLVHGGDDRNVRLSETADLVHRLAAAHVPHETLILPDEIHDFLLHRSWLRVYEASAGFLDRTIGPERASR